jgi:hypothetical protein
MHSVVGLRKETATLREVLFAYLTAPKGHNYLDGRPTITDGMNEFEAVHGARHLNVCKDHSDIAAVLEDPYCFVSGCGFNDLKARILIALTAPRRTSSASSTMRTAGVFEP